MIRGKVGAALCAAALVLAASCTMPYAGDGEMEIWAVSDWFHSGIMTVEAADGGGWEYSYYTFADRQWYLEQNLDAGTAAAAALLPTEGVLTRYQRTDTRGPAEVTTELGFPYPPNGWRFRVSGARYDAARAFIESHKSTPESPLLVRTGGPWEVTHWATTRAYHTLYTCLQFTAEALDIAGVDFAPSWSFYTNQLLRDRLNFHTEMVF